ncbi:PSD1 and planctomycete cytochrome C domain-containing protein [Verrucomicrobiota bacterium sgz303538]
MKLSPFSFLLPLLAAAASTRAVTDSSDSAGVDFFEKKIRPVLLEKCYKCHSADAEKIKGGLVLDTREGIRRGGDNGPAVVPGNLDESLLIEAVRYHNKDFAMPPEKSGGKLPESTIADFEKWVKMGAPDPRDGTAKVARKQDAWESAKDWWAWQPIKKPAVPGVNTAWPRSDIDRFVLSGLEAKSLKPVTDADPLTLVRRIYFDLIGLPPSPKDAVEFQREYQASGANPKAVIGKLVDRLLASSQFGERWGRHWLDVARYAESTGKESNVAFPHAWRYRDYVIAAFNADKPYDQFVREQLAGDLLRARDSHQEIDQKVATGFLAIGPMGLNEQNPRQFALDLADEQIDTVSQAFLGMTVACARCHDHKFDPISQKEYYALAGIFLSTDTKYGTPRSVQNRHPSDLIELPAAPDVPVVARVMSPQERAEKQARLEELQKEQREFVAQRLSGGNRNAGPLSNPRDQQRRLQMLNQAGILDSELKAYDQNGQPKALAMGVQDLPATRREPPRFGRFGFGEQYRARIQERLGGARPQEFSAIGDSALYARGEPDKPGEKVSRGFIQIISQGETPAIPRDSSGRRELADWIASGQNPLTARVFVNRAWHWLFGQGIVNTPDNFGTTGAKPSNPELLDYLASQFVESGWSVKALVKEIMTSRAYALASMHEETNFAADPQNTLVWRANERRLDAECLRDAMLSISGQMQSTPSVGSLIAKAGDGLIGGPRFRGTSEESIVNSSANLNVRSVYLPIARDVLPEALSVFDFPEPSLVAGARETTNVPSQALYMLNSSSVAKCAQKLAERVLAASPGGPNGGVAANLPERVQFAYWNVFSRPPSDAEQRAAFDFFSKFPGSWQKGDTRVVATRDSAATAAAWTSFCRALFASAEFRLLN